MNIGEWPYTLKDIDNYPAGVKDPYESVLANAVNAANFDLLQSLSEGSKVLEIGCGVASYLRNNLPDGVEWHGIDVYTHDTRGRPSIATKLGSVHSIPFENDYFDVVLSNQSIEHWFEYGVTLDQGLTDIGRVLRVGGEARINFPMHLHGHPIFVRGNLSAVKALLDPNLWMLESMTAFIDSGEADYQGWRRCGFPDKYVWSRGEVRSAFVVEMIISKVSNRHDKYIDGAAEQEMKLGPRLSGFRRAMAHGPYVMFFKLICVLRRYLRMR